MQKNQLAEQYDAKKLMKFTAPTMVMLVFMSLYQTVDGVFISNLVSELGLTALNVVYPFTSVVIALSIMLATGAGAIIALNMGLQKKREAKENFTFIVLVGLVIAVIVMIAGIIWIKPLIYALGATQRIYQMCYDYLLVMILATPLAMLQMLFQTFFVTAGKPKIGLSLTILGGILNIVLDYIFIAVFDWGIQGAAIATAIGYSVVAIYGLFYFTWNRTGTLYFVKPQWRWSVLKNTCLNGMSEMVNNLAVAITTYLFNIVGLIYLKEEGIAAISIVLYAQYVMTSVFMGYATGVAPIFSFKYGAQDTKQIQKIFKTSIWFVGVTSLVTYLLSFVLAKPIVAVFASHSAYVFDLAVKGFYLFAVSFLFTGVNIFASAMFTAFSNGVISALLSFLRTFFLLVLALIFLPQMIGENGIWLSVPLAEGVAVVFSIFAIWKYRKQYNLVHE